MIARRVANTVEFWDGEGRRFGVYHDHDPYKSFFRGLYTPGGRDIVEAPPHDHPHHKGLQFGLCAEDVNFWEEDPKTEPHHRRIGRQETEDLTILPASEGVGFLQEIVWRDDVCVSFHETRRISVGQRTSAAYEWTWQTTLRAARNLVLVKSAWPMPIGYCGLGLRLASGPFQQRTLQPDAARSGDTPSNIAFEGEAARVSFAQDTQRQDDVIFVKGHEPGDEFAFLSLGPTNGSPLTLGAGEHLERTYGITVSDR